jgi:hypothetical protein
MNIPPAFCTNHRDQLAKNSCPRCGAFVCQVCGPAAFPGHLCLTCRDHIGLPTSSAFLSCFRCAGPLEAGFIHTSSPFIFRPFDYFRKIFVLGQNLTTDGLSWQARFQRWRKRPFWGYIWLLCDRCIHCRHALIQYQDFKHASNIKVLAKHDQHRTARSHALVELCPQCERSLKRGYIIASTQSWLALEHFYQTFRFFRRSNLFGADIPWLERWIRIFSFSSMTTSQWHPIYRCQDCAVAILRTWERIDIRQIRAMALQISELETTEQTK